MRLQFLLFCAMFVGLARAWVAKPQALGLLVRFRGPTAAAMSTGAGEDTVVSRCTAKISAALSPVRLRVSAAHDDPNGSHIAIECVSSAFEGKPAVMRQRLIYKAIWDEMADGGAVHAVDQIIARTPEEDSAK